MTSSERFFRAKIIAGLTLIGVIIPLEKVGRPTND